MCPQNLDFILSFDDDIKSLPPLQEVKGAGAGLTAAVLLAMVNYTAGICNFASFFYS